jgi:hypothetical protein
VSFLYYALALFYITPWPAHARLCCLFVLPGQGLCGHIWPFTRRMGTAHLYLLKPPSSLFRIWRPHTRPATAILASPFSSGRAGWLLSDHAARRLAPEAGGTTSYKFPYLDRTVPATRP